MNEYVTGAAASTSSMLGSAKGWLSGTLKSWADKLDGGGGQGGGRRQTAAQASQPLSQAYAALGIEQSATDAEVKKAYRKLVGQYHPDKLVSQGLPEEMMEMARKRVREINTAYDRVKQARGFK